MSMKIMEKSTLCRICLAKDVRMCDVVNTNLQETYESLTAMQFETKDHRPSQVCYICYAQLQTCHRLRYRSLQSEELFRQVSECMELKLAPLHNVAPLLTIQLVTHFSLVSKDTGSFDTTDMKDEKDDDSSLDCSNIDNVQVKAEHVEGDADDVGVVDDNGKDNVFKAENTILPLSAINNSGCKSPVGSRDVYPKTVKIVVQRLQLTNIGTSVPAPIELTFTEEENKTVSGEEVVNDSSEEYINKTGYFSSQPQTNITDRPYKCDICGKCFKSKSILSSHIGTHTNIKPYKCDICGKCFKSKTILSRHIGIHTGIKPYICDICGKDFKRKDCLLSHMVTHSGIKPYACDICGKDFKRKHYLSSHMFTHTRIRACHVCGKDFYGKDRLLSHMVTHTGRKPYACNICGKDCKRKDRLLSHMVTHTGIKPYACNICGKDFKRKDCLLSHMATHSSIKPYACDIGGKNFRRKDRLLSHMVTQTGIKPYTCDIFGKDFKRKDHLSSRMLTQTGVGV